MDHDRDGRHDFYFGHWKVRNARLKERLTGCQEWVVFEATHSCRPILGDRHDLQARDSP